MTNLKSKLISILLTIVLSSCDDPEISKSSCNKIILLNGFEFHYQSGKLLQLVNPSYSDINFEYNSDGLLTSASNGFGWAHYNNGNLNSYVSTAVRYIITDYYCYNENLLTGIIKFRRDLNLPPSTPPDTLRLIKLWYDGNLLTQEVTYNYASGVKRDSTRMVYEYNSIDNKISLLKNELLPYRFSLKLSLAEILSPKHLSKTTSGFESDKICEFEYDQQALFTKYYYCGDTTSVEYTCE